MSTDYPGGSPRGEAHSTFPEDLLAHALGQLDSAFCYLLTPKQVTLSPMLPPYKPRANLQSSPNPGPHTRHPCVAFTVLRAGHMPCAVGEARCSNTP